MHNCVFLTGNMDLLGFAHTSQKEEEKKSEVFNEAKSEKKKFFLILETFYSLFKS